MEQRSKRALAFIETDGRAGMIAAIDIMPKAARVSFVRKISLGRGIMAVVFEGDVGAARSALKAGEEIVSGICKIIAVNIIPGPHERIPDLIYQKSGKDELLSSAAAPLALGVVESLGFTGMIEAADAGIKAAKVEIPGWLTVGGGMTSVFYRGDVGAVKAAVEAGEGSAKKVTDVTGTLIIPHPHHGTEIIMPIGKPAEAEYFSEIPEESALGIIETRGFTALIEALDAGQKAAKIIVQGWAKIGRGLVSTIFRGEVANVRIALEAGISGAKRAGGFTAGYFIARPHSAVEKGRKDEKFMFGKHKRV